MFGKVLAGLAVLCAAASAKAAGPVTWVIFDMPPQYIFEGDKAGQGYKDLETKFLIDHLPQFEHHVVKASIGRMWYEIAHRDGICSVGMVRTKAREAVALMADRALLLPGFFAAVSADSATRIAPYLDKQGEIDLASLAGARGLTGAYLAGRVHSKSIENFIARPDRAPPLAQIISSRQIYNSVQSGRIDFAIGTRHEIQYFRSVLAGQGLTALPIRGEPRAVKTYISCSKGPTGSAVIAAINRLLRNDDEWAAFLAPMQPWVETSDMIAALAIRPDR